MSSLKMPDKVIFERLFDRGGYVLDFNDRTFAEFFREHGVNINDQKYFFNGSSKMKRLRAFWEIETNQVVGKVLEALLQYACVSGSVNDSDKKYAIGVLDRLQGKATDKPVEPSSEHDFLRQEFSKYDLARLKLDIQLEPVIRQRIDEIHKSLKAEATGTSYYIFVWKHFGGLVARCCQ